jgi:uncharacterized protein
MPTIVHFEIPADDVERSKKFYSDLFGWKIEKLPGQTGGGEDMEYWLITTTDDKGNKALGGVIMKRQGPQQPIINHIYVKSVDEYSSKVQQLGGKVHVPKTAVPGMGYFATFPFCVPLTLISQTILSSFAVGVTISLLILGIIVTSLLPAFGGFILTLIILKCKTINPHVVCQ